MKPPPFEYHRPSTTSEAVQLLRHGVKPLAGGQSLLPLLNMRLAAPEALVDITRIADLTRIEVTATTVRVGAAVRHADVERHAEAGEANPLLPLALHHVAHPAIRNRGTVVGSLAHADPAAELPAVLAIGDGELEIARAGDGGAVTTRTVAAADFFVGPLEADLRPGELVTHATFPALPESSGVAFTERARRHGDYALCGVAAAVDAPGGRVRGARVAAIGVHPTPLVVDVCDVADGASPSEASDPHAWEAAGARLAERCEPDDDIHASADYRRHLAAVIAPGALALAAARCGAGGGTAAAPDVSVGSARDRALGQGPGRSDA